MMNSLAPLMDIKKAKSVISATKDPVGSWKIMIANAMKQGPDDDDDDCGQVTAVFGFVASSSDNQYPIKRHKEKKLL